MKTTGPYQCKICGDLLTEDNNSAMYPREVCLGCSIGLEYLRDDPNLVRNALYFLRPEERMD